MPVAHERARACDAARSVQTRATAQLTQGIPLSNQDLTRRVFWNGSGGFIFAVAFGRTASCALGIGHPSVEMNFGTTKARDMGARSQLVLPRGKSKFVSVLGADTFSTGFRPANGCRILWLIALLSIFAAPHNTLAYEYEVQGKMTYRFVNMANGSIVANQEQDFSISVDDCRWFLKKIPREFTMGGRPRTLEDYIEASTDLTNFYFLVSLESITKGKTNCINSMSGMIGNGIAPYGQDPTIGLLWYAFASGCYFQKQATGGGYIYGVTPFKNVGYYSKDFRVKADWQLESAPPYLPQKIVFTGNYKFLDDNPDPDFPEPLNPTDCIYTAQGFTNIGGLTIPVAGFVEFPTTSSIATTFKFVVTAVTNRSATSDFTIQIPGTAVLSDFRPISALLPVAVPTGPTKHWPNLDASRNAYGKIIRTKKFATSESQLKTTKVVRIIILAFLLLISGCFLSVLYVKSIKTTKL